MEIPFDGILTLLIFLVGIPALVLQLISATERRTVLKKGRLDVKSFLIWAIIVLAIGLSIQFWFAWFPDHRLNELKINRKIVEQAVWLGIFIGLFILALLVASRVPEQYGRREKIVEKLSDEVLEESLLKMRVGGGTFSDLSSLGKHCDSGQEREMVVISFRDIVKNMLSQSGYKGASFEMLVEDLVHMLASDPSPADLTNYDVAIETLSAILATSYKVERDEDLQRALHAVSKLGQSLVIHFKSVEKDHILLKSIDALELALAKETMLTEVSQALFEIGSCALEEKQDFVTAATLDRLTAMAGNHAPLPVEFVADLCGLLSHYWVLDGSRKKFVQTKFSEIKKYLPGNYMPILMDAHNHLIQTMYFDEADNLAKMMKEVKPKPRRKK